MGRGAAGEGGGGAADAEGGAEAASAGAVNEIGAPAAPVARTLGVGATGAGERSFSAWPGQANVQAKATAGTSRVGSGQLMSAGEVYQKTKKVPDLFWNRFVCRPVAAVVVDLLKGTRVTPNQITLASFVVAMLAAALLIFLPGHAGLVVAVVVYQASYVLDCADGMLARWRGIASPAGHLLDFLMDELKAFAILAAAAMRLAKERPEQPFLLIGLGGLVALASGIALTSFLRHPEIAPPKASASEPRSSVARAVRFVEGIAKFLIHYPSYVLYVAIAGHLEWYLYPYVAVNTLYATKSWLGVALRFGRA